MNLLLRTCDGPTVEQLGDPASKVLVVSPHQDDEVIGCGGTLRKLIEKGSHIKVLYLTDGGSGNGPEASSEISDIRKREAEAGLKVLGVDDMEFLDYPDGELWFNSSSIEGISKVLNDYLPEVIFVPFYLDNHPDHAAAARMVAASLRKYPREVTCYSYEVWTALSPNVVVDITQEMDMKVRALMEHKSQIAQLDYPQKVKGLNSYRSMSAGPNAEFCEAFIKQTRKELINMLSK